MLVWSPFMWPNRTLGTIMVPRIFIFKNVASQAFYCRVASNHREFWTKINALQLLLYLWKICNLSKNPWIEICIYFGPKCSLNWCDTAIESLRCKPFENKHFGYHYGTQRGVRSHEGEPYRHWRPVYISIMMDVLSILGTMIVPKNIFVWKSDI